MSQSFLARLPLARSEVDRDYLGRDDAESLATGEGTRFLVLREGLARVDERGGLVLLESPPEDSLLIYLGRSLAVSSPEPVGTPLFAAVIPRTEETVAPDPEEGWISLRSSGSTLSDRDSGLFAEALAMANWHAATSHSPRSGAPATPTKGGWVLLDSDTGAELFPRTDMAVIVGVIDASDRLLLGSNALWESNRYSLLAGFVEPGESLEAAVAREVFEESGMNVIDPRYLGSQPWPFPASLMIGFLAKVDEVSPGALTPDGEEIVDLRWFTRAQLHGALGEILLPGPSSIARAIIEEWYGGPVELPPTTVDS